MANQNKSTIFVETIKNLIFVIMETEQELVIRRKAYNTISGKYKLNSSEMNYAVYLDTPELVEFCEIITGVKI